MAAHLTSSSSVMRRKLDELVEADLMIRTDGRTGNFVALSLPASHQHLLQQQSPKLTPSCPFPGMPGREAASSIATTTDTSKAPITTDTDTSSASAPLYQKKGFYPHIQSDSVVETAITSAELVPQLRVRSDDLFGLITELHAVGEFSAGDALPTSVLKQFDKLEHQRKSGWHESDFEDIGRMMLELLGLRGGNHTLASLLEFVLSDVQRSYSRRKAWDWDRLPTVDEVPPEVFLTLFKRYLGKRLAAWRSQPWAGMQYNRLSSNVLLVAGRQFDLGSVTIEPPFCDPTPEPTSVDNNDLAPSLAGYEDDFPGDRSGGEVYEPDEDGDVPF